MPTASKVIKVARNQIGVCESPANSNMQKYGKAYGWNGTYWCAQFVWWCGWKAAGKNQSKNPIAKSASAAYIQDETVSQKGGKWVMKKTSSASTRKSALKKYRKGDIVSFDFGAYDCVRDHVGLVDHVDGDYVYCIEGNTSKSGSQSNGGMVCKQKRHYSHICSAVRPDYSTKLDLIAETAVRCAWAYGTAKSKYSYPNGNPKKAYKKALNDTFKDRSGWRDQTKKGASCDVAVAVVVRASGVDKKFPRGCDDILSYMKKKHAKKKWKSIKKYNWRKWKPGTVVFQIYKSGGKHIFIYIGNGKVFNAHYVKRTYPRIEKASKITKSKKNCSVFKVYVPK